MTGPSESAVDRAKRLGTYGKIDRSKQYEGEFDSLDGVVLRRKLQSKYDALFANRRREEQLKFHYHLVLIAAAAVIARVPEIYSFLKSLF